jgi:3-hydroxymyristoyl/3-hydroxydecanoyl-(acyl carrier protein) dehydratase
MGLKKEITGAMKNFSRDSQTGEISAEFAFDNDFIGFQGHFPGKPILPGVCQVEMALAILEKALKQKLTLTTLTRGKFMNAVTPNETVQVSCTFTELPNDTISAKFAFTKPAAIADKKVKVSRLSLIVTSPFSKVSKI